MSKRSLVVTVVALAVAGCGGSTANGADNSGGAGGSADQDAAIEQDAATPDGSETGPEAGAGAVGDPCTSTLGCPAGGSGTPACLIDWPGGYCAVIGCAQHGHDCPNDPGLGGTSTSGAKCVLDPTETCLALCAATGDCRAGYVCEPRPDAAGHGSTDVCVPASPGQGGGGMGGSGGGMMGGDGGM